MSDAKREDLHARMYASLMVLEGAKRTARDLREQRRLHNARVALQDAEKEMERLKAELLASRARLPRMAWSGDLSVQADRSKFEIGGTDA